MLQHHTNTKKETMNFDISYNHQLLDGVSVNEGQNLIHEYIQQAASVINGRLKYHLWYLLHLIQAKVMAFMWNIQMF